MNPKTKKELIMGEDSTTLQNNQQDRENTLMEVSSVQRCPHDRENPYVQINRDLLRNSHLSFAARGLLAYLLSFDGKWSFTKSHICKTQNIGKDALSTLFKELEKEGHILIVTGKRK